MSKRPSKTGVPHLSFQAQSGFQFYLTLPKHFSLNAKLPAQIRWSLGHDEPLARELAAHLNTSIQGVVVTGTNFDTMKDILDTVGQVYPPKYRGRR